MYENNALNSFGFDEDFGGQHQSSFDWSYRMRRGWLFNEPHTSSEGSAASTASNAPLLPLLAAKDSKVPPPSPVDFSIALTW